MIKQLAHLCFRTDQLAQMTAFYRDVLGLTVQFTFTSADGVPFGCYFALGSTTYLEIFDRAGSARQWGGDTGPTVAVPAARYGHFCLKVVGLETFCQTLQGRGVKVGAVRGGLDCSKQAWLADPDGNAIELMEYTTASLQLAPPGGVAVGC